ncbi:WXG100 family type VII secretion target [Paenibacillus sp. ACRSA]|uniref:WXG100 family type VII secretion target n=1 Tax=Paenibacillus sp. ACRSA TaxID=2918211 RepID=UPI0023B80719|nr:WXG100 family type VII secretion target [Paenibacillus sp. ACRSA]
MSTIKITPEQLHHVSTQVEQARQQLEQIRGELTRQIMFVRLMWMGATQERFFYEFERSGSILDKALESMVNTSKELKDIATRFEDADAQSVSLGGAAGAVGAAAMMTNSSGTGSGDKGYRMAHVNFYGRWMWLPVNENGVADQASLQAYEKDQGHLDFNKMQAVNVEPPEEDIFALQIKAFELGIDPFSGRPVSEDYAKWMVISLKAGQIFMGFQMIRGSIPGRQGPLRLPSSHPSVKKMKGYIEEAEQAKRKSSDKAGSANGVTGDVTLGLGTAQSRINIANGRTRFTPLRDTGEPVSAGFDHTLEGHFNRPLANSRSIFSIEPDKLKEILQSSDVVKSTVTDIGGGQFTRTVNVGEVVGNSALKYGGGDTTWIKIFTDKAGNLITTYPVPAP